MSKLKFLMPFALLVSVSAYATSFPDRPPFPPEDVPEEKLVCNDMLLTMCMDANCMGLGRDLLPEVDGDPESCAQQCIERYCRKVKPRPSPFPRPEVSEDW